jgi:hypothetical protein
MPPRLRTPLGASVGGGVGLQTCRQGANHTAPECVPFAAFTIAGMPTRRAGGRSAVAVATSAHGRLRDELLNAELFTDVCELMGNLIPPGRVRVGRGCGVMGLGVQPAKGAVS